MARVFISHAGADSALAAEVHDWLSAEGHDVFLDRDLRDGIEIGEEWEARLGERLRWADAVVSLITTPYLESIWCTFEISIARDRGSRVLPVIAEEGVRHPLLKSLQYTDLAGGQVARDVLSEVLRRIDAAGGAGWPDDRSPFPGLVSFDVDLRKVFFGRADDVSELVGRLRSPAEQATSTVLLVVGPSGCGKSSLVRAGMLPVLADEPDWLTLAPMRPRADPTGELARQLAEAARSLPLNWTPSQVREQLMERGLTAVVDDLLIASPGRRRRLLIVVDQFEELLTQTPPAEKTRFAELLADAMAGPLQVVATLRPEFLDRIQVDPDLAILSASSHLIGPLRREALRSVVEGPAKVAGIGIPDELVDKLVEDTSTGDGLPLLAFTLEQLAEGVRRGGALSAVRYRQLGGVQGALVRQADIALQNAMKATGRSEVDVIASLLRLVTVDEDGQPTRWAVNRAELPQDVVTELDAFVERRLLTTNARDEPEHKVVELSVAHEAFLSAWPPLDAAIKEARTALRARRAVEHAAADWSEQHRPADRLWERAQLDSAVLDTGARIQREPAETGRTWQRWLPGGERKVVTDRVELSSTARDFLYSSITRDRQRRRLATTILSVLLVLALTAAGIAAVQSRVAQNQQAEAESQQRIAIARQLVAQAETAGSNDPQLALKLAIAADRIDPSARTRSSLVNTLISTRYAGTLTGHTSEIGTPAFTPDSRLMATTGNDGTVILWDASGTARPRAIGVPLKHEVEMVGPIALSPDGKLLAVGLAFTKVGDAKMVLLWDIADPAHPKLRGQRLDTGAKQLARLVFSPDGRTLAVGGSFPAIISLWNVAAASRLGPVFTVGQSLYDLQFFADSRVLLTAASDEDYDKSVSLWDLSKPAHPRIGRPIAFNSSAAFNPARRLLATDGIDSFNSDVFLRDLTNPAAPRQLGEPLSTVRSTAQHLFVSPDGKTLAIGGSGEESNSYAVRLVDIANLADPRPYDRPPDSSGDSEPAGPSGSPNFITAERGVTSLVFLPDRPVVATISGDYSVRLWDLADRMHPRLLGEPIRGGSSQGRAAVVFPDGRRVLTSRTDGPMVLWDITDPGLPRSLGRPLVGDGPVSGLAFSEDARWLSVGRKDTMTRIDISETARPRPAVPQDVVSGGKKESDVVFDPRGTVAAAGGDGQVTVMDTAEPSRRSVIKQPFFPGKGGEGVINDLGFSPDGKVLAIDVFYGFGSYLTLWDTSDPGKVQRFGPPLDPIDFGGKVAFSGDGHLLARPIVPHGGTRGAQIWDVGNPREPRELGSLRTLHTKHVTSVAISPDGRILATGSEDQTIVLTDLSDPSHPTRLGLPLTPEIGGVGSLAFSPDGRLLATGGDKGTVVLWDLADPVRPRPLGEPLPGRSLVRAIAFTPDGRKLAVAGAGDGTVGGQVTLTDLSGLIELREHPTELACARVGTGLDVGEWAQYVGAVPYQETCGG
ncbi:TIR domain-containing protein [Kribbella catacumbae]|uniref:nSTAND1 domain-containing NTPase n=1 Tax=Kribbella catacumbae TaxID=460086 RepID=UPI00037F35F7|nr:TIR domain-containing protein [Kribbella catacumbae]